MAQLKKVHTLGWKDRIGGLFTGAVASAYTLMGYGYYDTYPEEAREKKYNRYPSWLESVSVGVQMFFNETDYGGGLYSTIVSYRAARVFKKNFTIIGKEGEEMKFAEDFVKRSGLRGFMGNQAATYGEIQGQALLVLDVEEPESEGMRQRKIKARFVPAVDKYLNTASIHSESGTRYRIDEDGKGLKLGIGQQAVADGRYLLVVLSAAKEYSSAGYFSTPSIPSRLTSKVEYNDEAAHQTRIVNRIYARPMLTTNFEEWDDQQAFEKWAAQKHEERNQNGWKIGQMLNVAKAKLLSYLQADNSGTEGLREEKHENLRDISLQSGVPMHKLGRPGDVNAKATAGFSEDDALFGFYRDQWEDGLLELIRMAIRLSNKENNTAMDPEKIEDVRISAMSPEMAAARLSVLAADRDERRISKRTYLEQHPLIEDPDEEIKRIEEEAQAAVALLPSGMGSGGGNDEDDEDDGDGDDE